MTFATAKEAQDFLTNKIWPADEQSKTKAVAIQTTHGHWAITSVRQLDKPPLTCSICGEQFHEFPNNAQPINDGRCCAYCDDHVVTPARMRGEYR